MLARLRPRVSYANVTATMALLVALGGGALAASSFVGSNGQIHGCVDKKGHLSVVKAGKKCGKGKTEIAWNQRGPRGLRGPHGPPGTNTVVRATRPKGMTLVGTAHDLCIDSSDRATDQNWSDARYTCQGAGLRLPSHGEALEASSVLNAAPTFTVFWTDDAYDYNNGTTDFHKAWTYEAGYGPSQNDRDFISKTAVRCVATPSDAK